jgi:hypothetical protein
MRFKAALEDAEQMEQKRLNLRKAIELGVVRCPMTFT